MTTPAMCAHVTWKEVEQLSWEHWMQAPALGLSPWVWQYTHFCSNGQRGRGGVQSACGRVGGVEVRMRLGIRSVVHAFVYKKNNLQINTHKTHICHLVDSIAQYPQRIMGVSDTSRVHTSHRMAWALTGLEPSVHVGHCECLAQTSPHTPLCSAIAGLRGGRCGGKRGMLSPQCVHQKPPPQRPQGEKHLITYCTWHAHWICRRGMQRRLKLYSATLLSDRICSASVEPMEDDQLGKVFVASSLLVFSLWNIV